MRSGENGATGRSNWVLRISLAANYDPNNIGSYTLMPVLPNEGFILSY